MSRVICECRSWCLGFLVIVLCTFTAATGAATTIPLHVIPGLGQSCEEAGDPCATGTINLTLELGEYSTVIVYLKDYGTVSYLQTAFSWPADWQWAGAILCQPGLGGGPYGPGPGIGTLSANFLNCLTGGVIRPVARFFLLPLSPGCVEQVESSYPYGTHIVTCDGKILPVGAAYRGSVCAGSVGTNVCDGPVPVEATTWGAIKSQF